MLSSSCLTFTADSRNSVSSGAGLRLVAHVAGHDAIYFSALFQKALNIFLMTNLERHIARH